MVASQVTLSRKVVDEVSGWLRVLEDGTVDRTWAGPPEVRFMMESVLPYDSPLDGITLHDLPGDPNLRLYLPDVEPNGYRLPVLLHFHGGGFCISHYSWLMYHQFYSRLARTIPAILVSVELPLAPEQRLPAAIDAGYSALLRLRSLALARQLVSPAEQKLCSAADFSRVFLVGDSSGGNLVHEVASRAGRDEGLWPPLKLAGGVPIHPGFVRSSRSESEMNLQLQSAFLTLDMLDKFLSLALPEGSTKDHPISCPMGEAAPPLGQLTLPPFLVAVADGDLIRDTNLEYCEAMKRAGKDVEVFLSKDVGHSFYLNKIAVDNDPTTAERTQELILAIKNFVHKH